MVRSGRMGGVGWVGEVIIDLDYGELKKLELTSSWDRPQDKTVWIIMIFFLLDKILTLKQGWMIHN